MGEKARRDGQVKDKVDSCQHSSTVCLWAADNDDLKALCSLSLFIAYANTSAIFRVLRTSP